MKKTLRLLTISLLFILFLVITSYPAFGQLKEGNLIWTMEEENIFYILRSNKTEPSIFLDIPKTFNFQRKYRTGVKLVSSGKSVFWLDYDYGLKKDNNGYIYKMDIYKMDIDSSKPSVVVDLSQKAGSEIAQWLPSSLMTDGKSLFWLGKNSEEKLFIYRSDINGGNFSVFFELPIKSRIKHLTTDGKFIYMHTDGVILNQFGGIERETQLLVKMEISNPVLFSIDALSILRNWAGEGSVFSIEEDSPLITDGQFLYFTTSFPNQGDSIVRSDVDGQNPLMIAEPKYGTNVTSMTNNKNSLFWVLQYFKNENLFFQIHQSTFDGSSDSVLIDVPVKQKHLTGTYNVPSSIAFVSNNYLSSQLITVFIFLISLAMIVSLLWIFSKKLSNSDIKQETEPEA